MTFGRPRWLIALLLLIAALPIPSFAKDDPRIVQLTQQIRTTRQVLADTTDPVEKVDWEKRISLLELDLQNLRTRIAIEEKENRIASRVSRNPLYALREALASIDTDVRTSREASSQLVRKLHILETERAELATRMEKFSADPEANAESLAEIDEVMRNKDEEIRLYTLLHDNADLNARLASEATRIDESVRAIPVNPRPTVITHPRQARLHPGGGPAAPGPGLASARLPPELHGNQQCAGARRNEVRQYRCRDLRPREKEENRR